MMRALAVSIALAAGPASALTCLPPDALRLYTAARDAAETYMVVAGRFAPDPGLPEVVGGDAGGTGGYTEWRGRLTGRSLGPEGFATPFDTALILRGHCIGPWCLTVEPSGEMLVAVELTGEGPIIATDACSNLVVPDPTPDDVAAVERCHLGGDCTPRR